ncbi:MAG: alpha-L-rhamnosidase, partial [Clostridia bacterium]|nr:alpha-L-rhamnosidase [Clostridia bacterium]
MIDTRIREDVFPVAIVEYSGNIEGVEKFTEPCDMQISTNEPRLIHVTGKAYVILDFGKEYNGGVRVLMHHSAGGVLKARIRLGESVAESCSELGEKGSGNHHTLRDATVDIVDLSDMTFFESGFRFARVDFPEGTDTYIKSVSAVYVHRDLKPIGGFKCNDERVNEIFDTAARTLMLNMQRYIWDGIKRDRLVWVGDMHPETLGIICLFGSDPSVIESLEYSRAHTPLPAWINNIQNYSMWWIIILADYYRQTGDTSYILA